MFFTVTCNPALDWMMCLNKFAPGKVNRSHLDDLSFGGKGVNVSTILHRLGSETIASGFVAGVTGEALESGLTSLGIPHDFVHLGEGQTRINVKIKCDSPEGDVEETEVNGAGPTVYVPDTAELLDRVLALNEGDFLICSGSLAPGCPEALYLELAMAASSKGARCVIDTSGDSLVKALDAKPFLIKPNNHELAKFSGCDANSEEELIEAARGLAQQGAEYVLTSRGSAGAILVDADGLVARGKAPKGTLVNSVGAGDSMVAGFLWGLTKGSEATSIPANLDKEALTHALACGLAAGSATAFSTGLATKDAVLALLSQVVVE